MSFPREYNVAKKRIKKDMKSSNKISNKKISGVGKLTGLIVIHISLIMMTQL